LIIFALKNLDKINCDIQTEEIKNHRLIIIERITNIVDKIVSSNLRSLKLHPYQDLFFNNSVFLQIIVNLGTEQLLHRIKDSKL
jgi:hypothetical protein